MYRMGKPEQGKSQNVVVEALAEVSQDRLNWGRCSAPDSINPVR